MKIALLLDVHLGCERYSVKRASDFFKQFKKAVEKIIALKADVAIIAGVAHFIEKESVTVLINMMVNTTDYTDCADYDRVLIAGETTKNHIKRKSCLYCNSIQFV